MNVMRFGLLWLPNQSLGFWTLTCWCHLQIFSLSLHKVPAGTLSEFAWKAKRSPRLVLEILVRATTGITRDDGMHFVVVSTSLFRKKKKTDLQFISLLSICLLYFPITARVTDGLSRFARHWHSVAASPCNDKQIGSVDGLWWETVPIIPLQLALWAHTWVRTWLDLPFHFTRRTANRCRGFISFGHGELLRGYLYNLPPLIPRLSHIGSNIQG